MYYLKKKKKEKKEVLFPKSTTKKKSTATLIRKLDEVFSMYIRLRDSQAFGYRAFRCISCGQVKPFDQMDCGHFIGRTHMATRFDEENCHGECRNCLTPDMRVLTKDLRWIPLGDIQVGNELVGFDEEPFDHVTRRYRVATVLSNERAVRDVYEVELENGDIIKTTAEHKWLVARRAAGYGWASTDSLWVNGKNLRGLKKTGPHTSKVCSVACKVFEVVEQDMSNDAGWLAGMLDADGHICQQNIHDKDGTIRYGFRVGIAQSETYPQICERIIDLMDYFTKNKPCTQRMDRKIGEDNRGIISRVKTYQYLVTGSNVEKIQFLQRLRPMKISKVNINKLGALRCRYNSKVKEIRYAGKQEIVMLETSTHTYFAEGYAMHNCNRFSADHMIYYQRNLEALIGRDRLDLLIARGRSTKKWTAWELEILITHYREEVKRMQQ